MGMRMREGMRVHMWMGMLAVMLVMECVRVNGQVAVDETGIQPVLDTSHQRALQKNPADPLAKGANQKQYPVIYIFFNTVLMSLASGLGAVPFFFVKKLSKEVIGLANATACGVMLACSFDLVHEGEPYGSTWVIFGIGFGMLFVHLSEKHLSQYEDIKFESLKGAPARKILLVIGIMTAHAIGEGSGVGVAYSGRRGWAQGVLVTLAIGLHNIPEGLAVATVMIARGVPAKSAIWWTIMTAMPQAVVALPSYLFVESFTATLPIAMGFAAGSMIWVVFAELVPDALEDLDHGTVATTITVSAAWLEGLRMALSRLETPDGLLASPIQADWGAVSSVAFALAPVAAIQCVVCLIVKRRMRPSPWILGSFLGVLIAQLGVLIFQNSAKDRGPDSSVLWALLGVAVGIGIYTILPQQSTAKEVGQSTGEESDPPQDLPITWPPGMQQGKLSGLSLLFVSALILLSICVGLQLASAAALNLDHLDYIVLPGLIGGILLGWMAGVGVLFLPFPSKHSTVVALTMGSLPAICTILSLLPYPIGTASQPGMGSVTNNQTRGLSFFLCGLLSVCMLGMLHGALSINFRQARNGCIAGFAVASVVQCMLGGLCIGTPYCL